jgi:hypothetical protein
MAKREKEPKGSSKKAMKPIGTRKDVYNRKAERTTGGLIRTDLMLNSQGKVVRKRRHELAVSAWERNPDLRTKFAEGQAPLLNAAKVKKTVARTTSKVDGSSKVSKPVAAAPLKGTGVTRRRQPAKVPAAVSEEETAIESSEESSDGSEPECILPAKKPSGSKRPAIAGKQKSVRFDN